MADPIHIELGVKEDGRPAHVLPLYPQKWAAIVNRIGRLVGGVARRADSFEFDPDDPDPASLVELLGGSTYEALCVFVPNLPERMPEWKFAGYGSEDAYLASDYDERQDQSPTFPQLMDAFEAIIEVNGGKRFRQMLGKEGWTRLRKAWSELQEKSEPPSGSPSSSSTSDGSEQPTSSGTTGPTSDEPDTSESAADAERPGIPLSV